MFCPSCGKELEKNSKFCGECGAKLENKANTSPAGEQWMAGEALVLPLPPEEVKNDWEPLRPIVKKNVEQYFAAFDTVAAGGYPPFHWAAFCLGTSFCIYRGCWELVKRYFLLPALLSLFGLATLLFSIKEFSLFLLIGGIALVGIGMIWNFVSSVRIGKRFYADYLEHCQRSLENPKAAASAKGVCIAGGAIFMVVAVVVIAGGMFLTEERNGGLTAQDRADVAESSDVTVAEPIKEKPAPQEKPKQTETVSPVEKTKPVQKSANETSPFLGTYLGYYYPEEYSVTIAPSGSDQLSVTVKDWRGKETYYADTPSPKSTEFDIRSKEGELLGVRYYPGENRILVGTPETDAVIEYIRSEYFQPKKPSYLSVFEGCFPSQDYYNLALSLYYEDDTLFFDIYETEGYTTVYAGEAICRQANDGILFVGADDDTGVGVSLQYNNALWTIRAADSQDELKFEWGGI